MAIKAVHLEAVSDLSSSAFLPFAASSRNEDTAFASRAIIEQTSGGPTENYESFSLRPLSFLKIAEPN